MKSFRKELMILILLISMLAVYDTPRAYAPSVPVWIIVLELGTDAPIAGASVSVTGTFDSRSGTTDATGNVIFDGLDWDTYDIEVSAAGYYDWSGSHQWPPYESYTVRLRPHPRIDSCDPSGTKKDLFDLTEDVYVVGSGYALSKTFDFYLVNDVTWTDGMPFPTRIPGTATAITSDVGGNIPPTLVWSAPLTPGKFDIAVDAFFDFGYDGGSPGDALDDMDVSTAGFFAIPEFPLGTITALMASIIAFGIYHRSRILPVE